MLGIEAKGRNDLVSIELAGGARLHAQITHDSTEKLELAPGRGVVALIKAGWLRLQPLSQPMDDTLNQLQGRIEEVLDAADGPSEVRIGLASGQTLCALVEPARLAQLGLKAGDPVRAQFAAGQVLLGTAL
ncbi:Transcriptional regulator ModE [compost metagenome]